MHDVWNDTGEDGQAMLREVLCGAPANLESRTFTRLADMDVLTGHGKIAVPLFEIWLRKQGLDREPD